MNVKNGEYSRNPTGSVLLPDTVCRKLDEEYVEARSRAREADFAVAHEDDDSLLSQEERLVSQLARPLLACGVDGQVLSISAAEKFFERVAKGVLEGMGSVKSVLLDRYEEKNCAAALEGLAVELFLPGNGLVAELIAPIKAAEDAEEVEMSKRSLQVFDYAGLASAESVARAKSLPRDAREQTQNARKNAMRFKGRRLLPDFSVPLERLHASAGQFTNFQAVIDALDMELTLAGHQVPENFAVRPILMNGVPGIGKTAFAMHVAEAMGLKFEKISAGGLQHAATLCGTAKHWANTSPGLIFNLLSESRHATAVLLIDEVDKLSQDDRYAILPAVLDLLEPESARHYKDEAVDVQFDASRLIVLLTSNALESVHEALQSRCCVVEVEEPTPVQRMAIMHRVIENMNAGCQTGARLALDEDAGRELAAMPIDIREMIATLRMAYAATLRDGSGVVRPHYKRLKQKVEVGFIPRS